ncbi:Phosphoglycerol transferase MdoB [Filimonas lacunae]|uniref:Phosphoglycerol transferase MdoB n=1 Tax=Filimonas lacunae TaxID=477680 RepID=A0A173MQE8_9BACT|nr:LTA synthase family protein [Filimonas lacunae]BAV09874.1 phosphoglycerol transferase and related proteins,alkaline phosphatase superfamily [Filimonas lacunae]SIS80316.1 Phosphoglycerol transferase MdoB [Filimonas lacunae]
MVKEITSTLYQRSRTFLYSSLFVLLLLLLCRIFFHIYYHNSFTHISYKDLFRIYTAGIYFDLSALAVQNALFILWMCLPVNEGFRKIHTRVAIFLFIGFNALGVALNIFDIAFFDFAHKRITFEMFNFGGSQDNFMGLIPSFLRNYWYLIVVFIIMFLIIRNFSKKFIVSNTSAPQQSKSGWVVGSILTLIIWMGLMLLNFRGWLAYIPIDVNDAGKFASAQNVPLVLNSSFTLAKSVGHEEITTYHFYSPEESDKIYSPVQQPVSTQKQFTHPNIVVIALESFSKEFTAAANKGISFTPFLDSLEKESLYFSNAWSNGKHSVQGIPAILASVPSIMDGAFTQSGYASNMYKGLAGVLNDEHYYTAFFHGANNGSFNLDAFASQSGYQNYFGRNEYNNETNYDGNWGIWDEYFLQYAADKMNTFQQPFHTAIFTLSSHQPFSLPGKYQSLFKGDDNPLSRCVQYTDYSLRLFFERAKKESWYNNTIFVLAADHTGMSSNHFFDNLAGQYQIPVILFDPSQHIIPKGINNSTLSQADIMPTLLHLTGYNKPFFAYGNDVYQHPSFAVYYTNGSYNMVQDKYLYSFNGNMGVSLYNYQADSLLQHNILKQPEDTVSTGMEKTLKAYLQSYTDGVKNNKMSVHMR